MHYWLALTLFITLVSCATNPAFDSVPSKSIPTEKPIKSEKYAQGNLEQVVKSPQGYVINGSKARFGGFVGDCASDQNFPYYWECQAENAGDNFH